MVLADASLRIELAAAEPEVVDPVAIRFDEDGRMWVVEMRDYPLGNPAGGEPLSRIRVLEDTDGDGRFESATTFSDKLLFVTGVQPWKGGAFVTLSGRVAYMKDIDGDGRADLDETWFEGFAEQNSQLRANHPRLALDNWIYVANGLRGGRVVNRKLPEQGPINISGMDFRFDPRTGKAEAVSGNGQFGLCFDDWGNRFTCSNRNPCRHVVIEDRYLRASPDVTVPAVVHDVAAFGEESRIFPISRAWTTSNLHAGQFTAACGVYVYRGDLLPAEFKGNVFTCDPTGNLIHREIMQPSGPTFTSRPAYDGKEFLASPDEWFRPVNMELGPDGALYVVDMYRCVIEHPDFVPDELKKRPDLRLGDDRGRIWRIVPSSLPLPPGEGRGEGAKSRVRAALSKAASDDLVALLAHPNAWQRETAQRLLLARSVDSVISRLERMAQESVRPAGRAHALATLAGLGLLEQRQLDQSLADADHHIVRLAIIWSESLRTGAAAKRQVVARERYGDHAACFQALVSAVVAQDRDWTEETRPLLNFIHAADPWMRLAIRIRLGTKDAGAIAPHWLEELAKDEQLLTTDIALLREVCEQGGSTASAALYDRAANWIIQERVLHLSVPALLGQAKGLARSGKTLADIDKARQDPLVNRLVSALGRVSRDSHRTFDTRSDAVTLLGYLPDTMTELHPMTQRNVDQAYRLLALNALSRQPNLAAWEPLLVGFGSETPPVRRAILDGVLTNVERTKLLLDAIEAGRIKASELDVAHVKRLNEHRDTAIKERAAKLLAAATPADRAQALADYQPVLKMTGDAKRGQLVFEKTCAACHRIAGIGVNVAPEISDSRTKKPEQLLADIIQPNRAIDNNYLGYNVRLLDGTLATGILTAETATSITLRQQGGKDTVIARSEIDELRSSGQSLMPDGLERQIPPPDMADLISFIKNWRYLDGKTPLATGP